MIVEYFADGETAPDPMGTNPAQPSLISVGSLEHAAQMMREHGVATLALRCWYTTGEREQAFVALANIEMDTLKEICANWLSAKYGDISIRWFQTPDERTRSVFPFTYWHAKFKVLPQVARYE